MSKQTTADDIITQKTALIDDLYNSRNEWRDRCLKAEAELEAVRNEIDGAKDAVETAKEADEYWKGYTARLEEKIIELKQNLKQAMQQVHALHDWHLIASDGDKPTEPVIVFDPFYGKIITSWDENHWRGYHFIEPVCWTELPAGPHNDYMWYSSSEKPEDGTIVIMKTIEMAHYDKARDMWAMSDELTCYWRRVEPIYTSPPPPAATE